MEDEIALKHAEQEPRECRRLFVKTVQLLLIRVKAFKRR